MSNEPSPIRRFHLSTIGEIPFPEVASGRIGFVRLETKDGRIKLLAGALHSSFKITNSQPISS